MHWTSWKQVFHSTINSPQITTIEQLELEVGWLTKEIQQATWDNTSQMKRKIVG